MTNLSPLEFYLVVHRPVTVFTGQVNGTPSDPYVSVTWDNGATGTASSVGTSGAPIPGNTLLVGTTAGAQDIGTIRIKSWTPASSTDPSTGVLGLAETDDVGPQITDGHFLTGLLDFRLWARAPRLVQDGENVTFFEDYDIAYTNQTNQWYPTVVAGPPAIIYLIAGSATASFVGDRSTTHATGASFSSHLWTAHGSSELTSSSQGTEGSPVTFTYTSAGQYLVSYTATDSNGNSSTSYTWVFVIDPDNPTSTGVAYENFDAFTDSGDRSGGGGDVSFTVHGVASVTQFPRDTLVVHAKRGDMTTETGTWPFRADTLNVGHIMGNTIVQDPQHNTTTFRLATINRLMNNLKAYAATLTDNLAPNSWVQAKDLTVGRLASYLFKWRSTLDTMTPVVFSGYSGLIQRQDFGPTTLLQQLQSGLLSDAWVRAVANHQNVLYLEIEYNYQLVAERATVTERKLLHKGIWAGSVNVAERQEYEKPASKVKTAGILYGGGGDLENVTPLFCEAPGDLPKAFGREIGGSRFILEDQDNLNIRSGFMLARENQRFPSIRMTFINDGSFTIAPQEVFPAVIESGDNNRGLDFTPDLIPRRIRRTYNHQNGTVTSEVEFEISSTGPPGQTVTLPATPPRDQYSPEPPPIGDWEPTDVALIAWKEEGSMQYYGLGGVTWEDRDTGLTGTDKLDLFGQIDPWWWTFEKQGTYNPEAAIPFKLVQEKILRSVNAGRINWEDVSPGSLVSGTMFVGMDSDLFTNKSHFIIGRWTATGTTNHFSGIWTTDDDGATWSFVELT